MEKTESTSYISYAEYDRKMGAYENAVQRLGGKIHALSPDHPIRRHLKLLVFELKQLPEDILTKYLKKRHHELFSESDSEN